MLECTHQKMRMFLLMKDRPDFNDNGDLPLGIHQGPVNKFIENFGKGTPKRRVLAQRYKDRLIQSLSADYLIYGFNLNHSSYTLRLV